MEQLDTQLSFQIRDLGAQGRLSDVQDSRGSVAGSLQFVARTIQPEQTCPE